jgi:hypothetical protein
VRLPIAAGAAGITQLYASLSLFYLLIAVLYFSWDGAKIEIIL